VLLTHIIAMLMLL